MGRIFTNNLQIQVLKMLKCTYIIDINACLGQVGGFVALTDLDISFIESGNKTGTIQC